MGCMTGTSYESESCQSRITRQELLYLIQICRAKLFQTTYHLVRHMRGTAFETRLAGLICVKQDK